MNDVNSEFNVYQRGLGTALAPNWWDLIKLESRPLPEPYRIESSPNLGSAEIPPERYTSQPFHDVEVDKLWKRSWQVVCREEQIPHVGDYFVHDVANLSFLVVRVAAQRFKAYWNVCLHHGRKLVDHRGCGAEHFKCNYHSWTWHREGHLAYYPGGWDFPDVKSDQYGLREVQVGTWGGFLFINPDRRGVSLAEHLGSLPKHFESRPLDRRFNLWHLQKRVAI